MENVTSPDWSTFRSELKAFVYKRVKDRVVTDDIVQDVFLKVQTHISQLQESDKLTGWIYQIARNTIMDHFRKVSKVIRAEDLDWDSSWHDFNECVGHCLRETMTSLPPVYREALELTELHNVSQLDLADRLKISYSGAKSRVQRARQMLRERMEEQYRIEVDRYGNVIVCEDRVPCNCQAEPKGASS